MKGGFVTHSVTAFIAYWECPIWDRNEVTYTMSIVVNPKHTSGDFLSRLECVPMQGPSKASALDWIVWTISKDA
jgi:hypothetical protein